MTYDSKHIKILNSKDGYDLVCDKYGEYHSYLDGFDSLSFSRFLPRNKNNLHVIDLGAGDGRLYKFFSKLNISRYVACDISRKILEKHPGNVEKVVCDLENNLPFDNESFDFAISFFVIEHLENIRLFFDEVYRILAKDGVFLLGYFFQRRSFVWKIGKDNFKIKLYNHRVEDILKYGEKSGFQIYVSPVEEKGNIIGNIFVFEK